jgi:hypothetical protein
MNLVKIIILVLILVFSSFKILYAENHDTTEDSTETSLGMELETEEDVPLNDPFAGNAGSSTTVDLNNTTDEPETRTILYDYKLVGTISGNFESFVSLVDAGGQVVTLALFEELSEGLRLVDISSKDAVFKNSDGKYLIINFKNQIVEKDDYAKK